MSNTVTAGDSAFVVAGGSANLNLDATNDAAAWVMENASGAVIAGRDGLWWAAGVSGGSLNAGRDAVLISLDSAAVPVTATEDIYVWVFSQYPGERHCRS